MATYSEIQHFFSCVEKYFSSRAFKKQGKTLNYILCFSLHFLCALLLPVCFTTEQSTVKASLFVNYADARQSALEIATSLFVCFFVFFNRAVMGRARFLIYPWFIFFCL